MESLEIHNIEPDPADVEAKTFVMTFKRAMTHFEQGTVPELLSGVWPCQFRDRGSVTIRNANIGQFERPEIRDHVKQIVSQAEALARQRLSEHNAAQAQETAKLEDAKRRAAQINWGPGGG